MSIKWVKYMWALAFAMAVALICGAICSFINIRCYVFDKMMLPNGISGAIMSVGCAVVYILLVAIMSKLIVEGAVKYMLATSSICVLYVIWSIIFMALGSYVGGFAVTAVIAVYSITLAFALLLKDKVCGVLFLPVIIWHVYLAAMSFIVIRINL